MVACAFFLVSLILEFCIIFLYNPTGRTAPSHCADQEYLEISLKEKFHTRITLNVIAGCAPCQNISKLVSFASFLSSSYVNFLLHKDTEKEKRRKCVEGLAPHVLSKDTLTSQIIPEF